MGGQGRGGHHHGDNRIFESVPVDEQGLSAALAVLRLTRRYSACLLYTSDAADE